MPGSSSEIERQHLDYAVTEDRLATEGANSQVNYQTITGPTNWRRNLSTTLATKTAQNARKGLLEKLGFDPAVDIQLDETVIDSLIQAPQVVQSTLS